MTVMHRLLVVSSTLVVSPYEEIRIHRVQEMIDSMMQAVNRHEEEWNSFIYMQINRYS